MISIRFIYVITLIGLFIIPESISANHHKNLSDHYLRTIASGCVLGSASAELNIGMVRAKIFNSGVLWYDGKDKFYEVPKYSGKMDFFAGALWIGGYNDNNQLKIAAVRYHEIGTDFFPGPLSLSQAATDLQTCQQFNFIHEIKREEVVDFLNYKNNPSQFPEYTIPSSILNYPAHGIPTLDQSYYLAPFFDNNEDGEYSPSDGDYPLYDFSFCRQTANHPTPETQTNLTTGGRLSDQALKGDQTLWWVFNDAGNVHTESGGTPIGLEIRAQAYAFKQNDDIGLATYYTYEIINRSSETLHDVYVGFFSDFDLGYYMDDYIGSDVKRGLGYAYNGKKIDGTGLPMHYGIHPPAVGIDFVQGPYMDPDAIDNPKFTVTNNNGVITIENCDYSINGQNFNNNIIDDERYGMTSFELTLCSTAGVIDIMTCPDNPFEYYYRMSSRLNDGSDLQYGGNAHPSSGSYGPECRFMFPGESDPCLWNTYGQVPNGPVLWDEPTAGNLPNDRRAIQGSGPFTLASGGTNYVTIGVPWARAFNCEPYGSVEQLKISDDKIQRFFDNCFRVIEGPDAPDLSIQEMSNELILYLTNSTTSNNQHENYAEIDRLIVSPDSLRANERLDSTYNFEGYQVFQLSDASVTPDMLNDPDKARLVAQCDIKNEISQLVNHYYSEEINDFYPREEVQEDNKGLVHSFRLVNDAFGTGDKKLINHKKYYYMTVAYATNEYEKYSQDMAYQNPGFISSNGQKNTYLRSKRNIRTYTAIPHNPIPENSASVLQSLYGFEPEITRIEGQGNGGNILKLTDTSRTKILENNFSDEITYLAGYSPIKVLVIDPLNVKSANYIIRFDTIGYDLSYCHWKLEEYDLNNNLTNTYFSDFAISFANQQIFPQLGISVSIYQCPKPGSPMDETNGYLNGEITFSDSTKPWLDGIADSDDLSVFDWIKSGTQDADGSEFDDYFAHLFIDPNENYENILGGRWAPYGLTSSKINMPISSDMKSFISLSKLEYLSSVQIILTDDKTKWSRCAVIETCDDSILPEGNVSKMNLRKHPSVDKNGYSGSSEAMCDGNAEGMGWFPGYVINLETGERLNVIFGEDSHMAEDNGNDMIFNPTAEIINSHGELIFGGKHFIYIMGRGDIIGAPAYDSCQWIHDQLNSGTQLGKRKVYQTALWVNIPVLRSGQTLLSCETSISLNVKKPYARKYSLEGAEFPVNKDYPMYRFSTNRLQPQLHNNEIAKLALDLINVVPNPYYGNNEYENNIYDQKVKITNLPPQCTICIYNINGAVIRKILKDDDLTYFDWDLKNEKGRTVSGGMYLIHIKVPGIGEKIIKWFGAMHCIKTNEF